MRRVWQLVPKRLGDRSWLPTIAFVTVAQELWARGRALRGGTPRSAHSMLVLSDDRDPLGILEAQNKTRLADLVAVRIGRMLQSPFAYYRGTAAVMAADLKYDPVIGEQVVCCGDAHISNFGLFASPERRVLFDLNDFDEASNAPWEWDVKRLAASVVVGGRDNGLSDKACSDAVHAAVRNYRESLRTLCEMSAIDRYFFQVETDWMEATIKAKNRKVLRRTVKKARSRTSDQILSKLVSTDDMRIKDVPPVTQHVDHASIEQLDDLFAQYSRTLRADTALLLSQFRLVDYVLRVVGVGSVGTRCYVALFVGPGDEPLFLQVKEAPPSVLETFGGWRSALPGRAAAVNKGVQGFRVVAGQRILQAQSDPFLGWIQGGTAESGLTRRVDYYVRQFRDMKGSVEVAELSAVQFPLYGALCARLLARAHSQSPAFATIGGYMGKSEAFDDAVAVWALKYADQAEKDYENLAKAVKTGRVAAEAGV
nr:DUF2252 domain-containing protein [Hoyosella altamirensis]